MKLKRIDRVNSLLKEVISDVVTKEVKNPFVSQLITITSVETSSDLHHAKVFFSVIGNDQEKDETMKALNSAAGFIAIQASKKVTLRYFPALVFKIDTSVDKQMRIATLLNKIHDEERTRNPSSEESGDSAGE